jgi:hypothetical protein
MMSDERNSGLYQPVAEAVRQAAQAVLDVVRARRMRALGLA